MNLSIKKKCVFQRRSCTRTIRRRPYIMTQMRMPIPEKTNLITASCCSTDLYASPGASSVWSDITQLLFFFLYLSHSFSTSSTQTNVQYVLTAVAVESWNASALKNAIVSSLATVNCHPPTVSATLTLFSRECRSVSSRTRVGREEGRQSARPTGILASTPVPNASVLANST